MKNGHTPSFIEDATNRPELGPGIKGVVQDSVVYAWDTHTPRQVRTSVSGFPDLKPKALALMKDVLEMLTPERISAPRAEYVVGAGDVTGERARAELARRKAKKKTVDGFAPLAEGYPKIIRSDDHHWKATRPAPVDRPRPMFRARSR